MPLSPQAILICELEAKLARAEAELKLHRDRFAMRCRREAAAANKIYDLECEVRRLKSKGGRPVPLT